MYLNLRLFLKALRLALFNCPFRLRRWLYVLFFTGLFGVVWILVAVGRGLDPLLFPSFRKIAIRKPVFIVAPPRSGTTFTQKLMSLDEEHFVHTKLYQTIFPAICYQKLILGIARLDGFCGGPLRRVIGWCEKRWFGGWDDMHKMRFDQPEEDDGFFVYTFVSEAIYLLFPFVDELWEAGFADDLPPEKRRKVMAFYRSCLQRQLYLNGPAKTILSKATQSCGSLRCLMEAFPDARFITILRHPYQSVASHVSVFYPVWKTHSPEIQKDSETSRQYARLALEWYRHLYRMRSEIPPAQYYCIDFRDLARNPSTTIECVYAHFGLEMTNAFSSRLKQAEAAERHYKSTHQYTLEEFGLSKPWIQNQIGDLLDAYGLER